MKAIIFSAGLGTRLKPWTDHHPKALALVNGKSLLQRNIEYLQQFNISEVVVNVHHFAGQIIEAVEQNKGWGSHITISDETEEVLETGGGLLKARKLLEGNGPFLSLNADILTDLNIDKLIAFHNLHKPLVSFAVSQRKTSRYILLNDQNRMCGWRNEKTGEEKGPHLNPVKSGEAKPLLHQAAYDCVVIYEPGIFSLMQQQGKFSIMDTYLQLAADHLVMGYEHSGDKWVDVGKPESIAIAEKYFR